MAKSRFFLLLFVLQLFMLKAEIYAVNTDSLMQALKNMPQKQRALTLPTYSIYLLQADTTTAFKLANEYLHLSSEWVSNHQKQDFYKTLAKKLENKKDYEHALFYFKIADSLAHVKPQAIKPNLNTKTSISDWSFYLFIFLSIIGLALMIYFWAWRQRFTKGIKSIEKEKLLLKGELSQLQAALDQEIKTETLDVHIEMEKLQKKDVELKTALKKAEEASYLRNAFIANLGFDVRTPLSGIIGFSSILETELAVRENNDLYEYASNIEQSANRLLKLMNNIIDLSSLEANTLELKIKAISLKTILQQIYNQYKGIAQEKNLIFKSKIDEDLRPAMVDENGMQKAIIQIVDNAIKFTDQGFVTLSSMYDQEKDIDLIEIKDTGSGMDKENQRLLFGTELQSDVEQIKYTHGTGIGFKLAKKYIDLMRGRLEVISTLGKGTTVRIYIPCSDTAVIVQEATQEVESISEKEITTAADLGQLDVFVVEDDRMNRLILEKMLIKFGKVKLTVDGDDCMKTIDQEAQNGHFYQIMLFDINLPGDWDGVKLMKEIRKKYPEYRKIPFIAQTAYAMAGDKDHFLVEGFDSYLSKPIDKNELITTIKQQLRIHKSN